MAVRPQKLSQQEILEAALSLVDQFGLEQLSMRKLGSVLGVEAMALYRHFRNKADLLDGLHLLLIQQVQGPAPDTEWRDQVRQTAHSFRAVLARHPNAISLLASRTAAHSESLAMLQAWVNVFVGAGFRPAEAEKAFQVAFSFIAGHAAFHFARQGQEMPDRYREFPVLEEAFSGDYNAEMEFEFGLEVLIEGLGVKLG